MTLEEYVHFLTIKANRYITDVKQRPSYIYWKDPLFDYSKYFQII